jgi:hypothetical protein
MDTQRMLVEMLVALVLTGYCAAVLFNYRGLMDFFLRQTERNRRMLRTLALRPTPDHDDSPYPPNVASFRRWWRAILSLIVIAGANLTIARSIQLVVANV